MSSYCCSLVCFFFFKQKTAYELRISDWSSDVCSSDLMGGMAQRREHQVQLLSVVAALGQGCGGLDEQHLAMGVLTAVDGGPELVGEQIGRESCRERVCQYV